MTDDGSPGVPLTMLTSVAQQVDSLLRAVPSLDYYVRLSGGRGVHVTLNSPDWGA